MARFKKHTACPKCNSSDGRAVYDDGGEFCFVCKDSKRGTGSTNSRAEDMTGHIDISDVVRLPIEGLTERGISKETCELFSIRTEFNQSNGEPLARYAPLHIGGEHVGYHKRTLPKTCKTINGKDTDPFGAHVAGRSGKFLIVTEGVEDCLAVHEMLKKLGKNYRVVATLGTSRWGGMLSYFSSFEKVVIAFDGDAAGREAANAFAVALGGDKAHIARWDNNYNDPNDLLLAGKHNEFLNAVFKAEPPRPDGIVTGETAWERIKNYTAPEFVPFPPEFEVMNTKAQGMRRGEISLWIAGTGVGKTSFIRRIKQHTVTNTSWKVGEIELEEAPEKTIRGMLQFQGKKKLFEMSEQEKREAFEATYGSGKLCLLDHRARYTRGMSLMDKIKQMHYGLGCDLIVLDHITLAVSEFGDMGGNAEQDKMMNEFLEFVETTNTHLMLISHLRKSPASTKSFESGAVPREDDIKGSGSLKQISFDIFALSRNKHHEDDYERNVTTLHVLKCRETGDTGPADRLYWDSESSMLVKAAEPADFEGIEDDEF